MSATKKNKRDLQVVITSDSGSRPATTQDSTAARSSGALGRSSGRRVPFDAHGDRHLSRPRDALDGALSDVAGGGARDVMRPRPGTASLMYGVRQLRPATAPVQQARARPGAASFAEPSTDLFRRSNASLASLERPSLASTRSGLRFSKLTAARPVLASPHRRVQNPNPHRADPTLAHFAPLQTYNTNFAPNHRRHLTSVSRLRRTRHQDRIGAILAAGHADLRVAPSLAPGIPGKAVC